MTRAAGEQRAPFFHPRNRFFLAMAAISALALGGLLLRREWSIPLPNALVPQPGATLTVWFGSGLRGRTAACVCDGQIAGGLQLRGKYLQRQSTKSLQLDLGNVLSGTSAEELRHGGQALSQLSQQGCLAVNLSESDLQAGPMFLAGQADTYVSCNVLNTQGDCAVRPYVMTQQSGIHIAVTGITYTSTSVLGLQTVRPAEALGRLLPELVAKAELLVLLADGSREEAELLARDFPEFALILFRGSGESVPPTRINRSWLASIYEGRYLGRLVLAWNAAGELMVTGEANLLTGSDNSLSIQMQSATQSSPASVQPIRIEPEEIRLQGFAAGEHSVQRVLIRNNGTVPLQIGRILSTCSCVVLTAPVLNAAPGTAVSVDVGLKSLGLKGEQDFPVYFELIAGGQTQIRTLRIRTGGNESPVPNPNQESR